MSITSRIFWSVSACLICLSASALAGKLGVIQGEVKGPDGKLLQGAVIRIERKDASGSPATAKTDRQGVYIFKDLNVGKYALTASANGMAPTTINNVKARSEGAVRINFNLNQVGAKVVSGRKKATHMVWIPSDTGSNLGGRWVEVDDQGNTEASMFHVQRGGAATIKGVQAGGGTAATGD
jgi:hypothetical protein